MSEKFEEQISDSETQTVFQNRAKGGLFRILLLWFLGISLIPLLITMVVHNQWFRFILEKEAGNKIIMATDYRAEQIEEYLYDVMTNLIVQARLEDIYYKFDLLDTNFKILGEDSHGFVKSPFWNNFSRTEGGDIRSFLTSYRYYDFYFIDKQGNVLYSDRKEPDLGTNIFSGEYSGTLFGKACKRAMEEEMPVFSDFELYEPSNNTPSAFFITLVWDSIGDKVGLAAIQIDNSMIDRIMQADSKVAGFRSGNEFLDNLLRSAKEEHLQGETFLLGRDLRMRSNSILDETPTILEAPLETDLAKQWKEKYIDTLAPLVETDETVFGYTGRKDREVYGSYKNIEIAGVPLAVVTEIPKSGVMIVIKQQKIISAALFVLTALLVFGFAFYVSRHIASPIIKLSAWAKRVALGDLSYKDASLPRNEIGEMTLSFRSVIDSLQNVAAVCRSIAKGDFSKSITIRSKHDTLGRAINEMGGNLKKANNDSQRKISYLNNIPTTVHVIDKDYRVQFINEAGVKLLGIDRADCIGMKCFDLFNMEHCKTGQCRSFKAMRTGEVETGDNIAILPGGEMPCRYTSALLKDEDGNKIGAIEYIVDISDEMQIVDLAEKISQGDYSVEVNEASEEDRLSISLNRMTKNLHSMSEENERQNWLRTGIARLNDVMRGEQDISTLGRNVITSLSKYVNAQIGAFYIIGDNNTVNMVGSYAFNRRKNLSTRFEIGEGLVGQAALEKETIILTSVPDDYIAVNSGLGESVPSNIIVVPLLQGEKVRGVIELGTIYDFSEEEIDLLGSVNENIAIAIQTTQSRGKVQELLSQTQAQAEEMQAQQEELRQANEELEEQTKALKESESRLQSQQEELRQTNEELEEQTQVLEEQKTDIVKKNAELEKAQAMIEKKADDLEVTSKYKSEFLANMSHELRTPLNSILILSKLLSDNKNGGMEEKQIEFARTINSSGEELLNLINEILDLSKVESGKIELNLEDVNINGIAGVMKRNFEAVSLDKGLALEIDLDERLPETIQTDQQRVEQILKNLISNAVKFTDKGNVSLKIGRPEFDAILPDRLTADNAISFSVIDSGIGIPKDKLETIFEAFQQVDGTTSRKYGGSGLGLSISRQFAILLGGEIDVQSREGEGSRFTLYLPMSLNDSEFHEQEKAADEGEQKRNEQVDTGRGDSGAISDQLIKNSFIADDRKDISSDDKSILIIEDDPKFAKILYDLSREKGFKVLIAEDGEKGLHLADLFRPSGIILDVGLPGIDGWTVMSRLKEDRETRHIPVHFVSGTDKSHDAMKMGAVGFLTKPVSLETLDQVYRKIEEINSKPVKRLLVVEDDSVQRTAIEELIGDKDVIVTSVSTGEEANEKLSSNEYDCMIIDLNLPDMSGVELLARIRNERDLQNLPVVVYTGKELSTKEKVTLNKYAESIIIKGVNSPEKLLDETTLFLHRIEKDLPEEKREMLRMVHDRESILKDKKVLVTDDDMRNVFALTSILEEKGMEVLAAKNGREALECLSKDQDVDLVLMDIMMPEMDGYATMVEIRKQHQFKDLPVIALTAKAMKGDRAKCIEAGASDYLSKPVDTDKLMSMLRVWLY